MLDGIKTIVAVVGCQRSGTTLTAQILGTHPKAVLFDEFDGLYQWFEAWRDGGAGREDADLEIMAKAKAKYQRPETRLLGAPSDEVGLAPTVDCLVLQAPNLTYSYRQLAESPIPVRVIYPVRDPRSVVASMIKLGDLAVATNFATKQLKMVEAEPAVVEKFAADLECIRDPSAALTRQYSAMWNIKSALAPDYRAAGLPVFQFRYEDLVTDPALMAPRIAAAAGLSFSPEMIDHGSVYRGRGPGGTDRSRSVDTWSLSAWRHRLSAAEEEVVLSHTKELRSVLGYEGSASEPAPVKAPSRPPVVLLGRGGSGTRLLSAFAVQAGIFLGDRLNKYGDSIDWVDPIYELAIQYLERSADGPEHQRNLERRLQERAAFLLPQQTQPPGAPWGWKLPETMLIAPLVGRAFPGAKFVHLVRHPVTSALRRTHVTSQLDHPVGKAVVSAAYVAAGGDPATADADPEYLRNALTWLFQVQAVCEFARADLASENYLEIRYEDLCASPSSTRRRLCSFLDRPVPDEPPPPIDASRTQGSVMPAEQASEVWRLCGTFAATLGYAESDWRTDVGANPPEAAPSSAAT